MNRKKQKFERGALEVAEGKVKWFNEKKGFGFIEMMKAEMFLYIIAAYCGTGFKTLYEGQRICFGH